MDDKLIPITLYLQRTVSVAAVTTKTYGITLYTTITTTLSRTIKRLLSMTTEL